MEVSEILLLIGGVGGVNGITEAIKGWRRRHVQARHDIAGVVSEENENYRKQIDWYEQRLKERDIKVDSIYGELRAEQKAHLDTLNRLHEVELKLAEAEVRKCHKRGCSDRIPPSDY